MRDNAPAFERLARQCPKGRSVSQAKPAYAEANGCGAATRSLAAPHGRRPSPTARSGRAVPARVPREAAYLKAS